MSFSAELRNKAAHIWEQEQRHPFVTGIGDGSLALEKFQFYMRQDYIFLIEFCRVISLAVAKARSIEDMGWFARLLHETLNNEMALHVSFCEEFGITEEQLRQTEPSPTTHAYTRHLTDVAYSGSAVEIAVAILPCSWGYCEIGRMLFDRGLPAGQPLYSRWIEMYNSRELEELADWLRSFIDREVRATGSAALARMEEIFVTSSRYEYMFWDAAYRLEGWPV